MLFHVLMPQSDGGHVSLDYRDTLESALQAVRYWRSSTHEDMAIAKGVNGEPLRWVVYYRAVDSRRDTPISVHKTTLGAKRAYLKFGRSPAAGGAIEYGFRPVREW